MISEDPHIPQRAKAAMAVAVIAVFFAVGSARAEAATIYANSLTGSDASGSGSSASPYQTFTKAYNAAAGGDTLDLTGTFIWTNSGETTSQNTGFTIGKDITISGHGVGGTVIEAATASTSANRRVFTISSGYTVNINDLEIRNGNVASLYGGGIQNNGTLYLSGVEIDNNISGEGGAGVDNLDLLYVSSSTIDHNLCDGSAGMGCGLLNDYNIVSGGYMTVNDSTIAYNVITATTAYYSGAGIHFRNGSGTITNSTIAFNTSCESAVGMDTASGVLTMKNTIIADNFNNNRGSCAGYSPVDFAFRQAGYGNVVDNGGNIVGYSNLYTWSGAGDWTDQNRDGTFNLQASSTTGTLGLATSLAGNSNPTGAPTLSLAAGSIAIDNGGTGSNGATSTVPDTDERGMYRSGLTDIGAYEYGGSATPTNGLQTSWLYDDGSGSTASDSSGNGRNGTLVGSPTWTSGVTSGGMYFNGTSQYMDSSDFADNLSAFSVSAWFKASTTPSGHAGAIVAKMGAGGCYTGMGWMLFIGGDNVCAPGANVVEMLVQTDQSDWEGKYTTSTYTDGNWHNAVGVYSGGVVTLYVDGSAVATADTSGGVLGTYSNAANVRVANDYGSEYFPGNVDDVRIYDRALDATEVAGLYAASDMTAPTVSMVAPGANSTVSQTVTLQATASDNVSVAGVTFYVDGTKQGSEVTSGSGSVYSYQWDSTATTSGSHTVFAVARDSSDNYATSSAVTFTVDNTKPVISGISTSTGITSATISWTTSTTTSAKVYFGVSSAYGSSTAETDTSPRTTSHSVTLIGLVACSVYHFELSGTDYISNTGTSSDQTVTTTGCDGSASISSSTDVSIATSTGGSLTAAGLNVTVPVGFTATSSSAVFQADLLDGTAFFLSAGSPSGLSKVGSTAYQITAFSDATTTLTTFKSPITIEMSYSASDISGLDASTLAIYRYDSGTWTKLDGCVVDTSARTVSCDTSDFSVFAIFGSKASASSSGSSSTGTSLSSSQSGGTVQSQYANLMAMGLVSQAESLKAEYPWLFQGSGPVASSSGTGISVSEVSVQASPAGQSQGFARFLKEGMTGSDVMRLQAFLNSHGFVLAESGPGSPGHETDFFGMLTKAALARFQEAYIADDLRSLGLSKGSGIFGYYTMSKVNSLVR